MLIQIIFICLAILTHNDVLALTDPLDLGLDLDLGKLTCPSSEEDAKLAGGKECGDYWKKKMGLLFERIDIGGQRRFKKSDLMGVAERYIEVAQLGKADAEKLRALFDTGVWDHFFQPSYAGDSDSCYTTADVMIANIEEQAKSSFLDVANYLFGRYVDAVDQDKDNRICFAEYKKYFYIIGVNQKYAEQAFKALDTGKNGFITRDEFVKAGSDFIGLENPCYPSDKMFGSFNED